MIREEFEEWYFKEWADKDSFNKPEYEAAWYAWQEQQKRIDAVLKHIEREEWSDEYGDNQCPTQAIEELIKGGDE